MLAQLVCLDRRYQRMNCFNIRELQTLLRHRYHPELLDDTLHTDFLSQTSLSTRFKLFDLSTINPRMALFNEYPLLNTLFNKPSTAHQTPRGRIRPSSYSDGYEFSHLMDLFLEKYEYYYDKLEQYYYHDPIVTPFYQFYVSPSELNTPSNTHSVIIESDELLTNSVYFNTNANSTFTSVS
jgi:hypothetical protein